MSDAQKLKDCVVEFGKAKKNLDDKLNKAEERRRERQREQAAQSSHQS